MSNARTAKDEYKYDEERRREETIKTEVIVELRDGWKRREGRNGD